MSCAAPYVAAGGGPGEHAAAAAEAERPLLPELQNSRRARGVVVSSTGACP